MTKGTVLAVTGDVGAGKSTVSRLFEELGGFLIDADRVVADLWRRPDVIDAAVERWGGGVLDESGRVVHARVAKIIFTDRAEYGWTVALLHPRVRKEIEREIEGRPDTAKGWTVVEIPMLFESGVAPWVTVKVFVTASRSVRLERCRARGWNESDLAERESFFMDSERRMALSDFLIRNEGTPEDLRRAVREVYDGCN
ncbi:MAG: dephospho-CoA kinase [Synergistaceae bacterium]|nr:dephospho-CoA kinase [Synergistaceae bacterium]